jgi:hypothetical protein
MLVGYKTHVVLYMLGSGFCTQTSTKPRSDEVLYLLGSWGQHQAYKSHQVELLLNFGADKLAGGNVIT